MFNFLRCFISHDWKITAGDIELGPRFDHSEADIEIFLYYIHQEGTRECKRCGKIENVYRAGLIGENCDVIKWRRS